MGQMGQEEKRREAVGEYEKGGITVRGLARKHGLSSTTLHRWIKQAEAGGGIEELERRELAGEMSVRQKRELPADVKRLRKELEEARLHNELLNAMIDIAEGEMGVEIRKKPGAKRR